MAGENIIVKRGKIIFLIYYNNIILITIFSTYNYLYYN